MKKKNYLRLMLPFFIILILDQITKISTSDTFSTLIPKFLYINSFKNEAMIFNLGHHVVLLTILIVLILGFLFLFYRHYLHYTDKYDYLALDLFLAGIISNYIDRIFKGAVIDFIQIKDLPQFNLADLSLLVGSILLIITFLRVTGLKKFNKRAAKSIGSLYKSGKRQTKRVH